MRAWVCGLALAASAPAFAQEIGSEIVPVTPQSNVGAPNSGTSAQSNAPSSGAPMVPPSAASAGSLSFGLRAGFVASATPVILSGTGSLGVSYGTAPVLSGTLFVTDNLGLDLDLGVALGVSSGGTVPFGMSVGAGVNWYFRGPDKPVRPFVGGKVAFGKGFSTAGDDFSLGFQVGGGAAYFFSPNFAVDARALIGANMSFNSRGVDVVMGTVSPGLGATVFF